MNKKIPCKLTTYSDQQDDSNLMKVKLYVMCNGKNYNGSAFGINSMKDAEESIKNTPILAFLVEDEDGNVIDFDGHNMETKLVEGEEGYEIKTKYLERPIGLISESCNPRYEDVEGKTYFVVDGYIWKSYSNESYKLIEDSEFMSVSMEIKVDDGIYDEEIGAYDIRKYKYEAVTVLGTNVLPAIAGSKIMTYASSEIDYKSTLEVIYKEIYKLERKEDCPLEDNITEVVEEFELPKNAVADDETVKVDTPVEPEPEPEIEQPTEPETVEEVVEEFKVEDKEEDDEDEEFKKKRKCSNEEEFSLECFNVFFEEVPTTLNEVCEALLEKFNTLNEELSELREFKLNYDNSVLLNEVEEIIADFGFGEEEISELKEKAVNKEISTKEFKKELFALEGMKVHNEKKKFSQEKDEVPSVKINVVGETAKTVEPYGGLFAKFGKR